jgi:SAM-dependent methyltransferase
MQLTAGDFAKSFGVQEDALPAACERLIADGNLRYERPSGRSRDEIVLRVLKHITSDRPTAVGEHRAKIWEACWSDNLQKFVDAGLRPDSLVPSFVTPGLPVRLRQDYALPAHPQYELRVLEICRAFLFDKYFRRAQAVYEFGCGSGFNLVALAEQLPGKKLCGLDWSRSANDTVNLIRDALKIDITGRHFDFFEPDCSLALGAGTAVLTMCALEQVGRRHDKFLAYLLEKKPDVCVHMEPLAELYDEDNLVDHLALLYHRKRGYLEGFLTSLRALEAQRRIEILEARRFYFGSLYHEGYSFVAWRPSS